MNIKVCRKCGEEKEINEFYTHCKMKDGLMGYCKLCSNKATRKWAKNNRAKMSALRREWGKNNPKKLKECVRRRDAKRLSTIKGRISHRMRSSIGRALKTNKSSRHWENLVGYTMDDLKKHLERQFQPGMSWDNYNEWHIDHKIPISVFNFSKPEHIDFKRCWALSNLRPLWAKDNQTKNAKLIKPFQLGLLMEAA